jgi:hypothetical protein
MARTHDRSTEPEHASNYTTYVIVIWHICIYILGIHQQKISQTSKSFLFHMKTLNFVRALELVEIVLFTGKYNCTLFT